jgi:hypothetical protein
MRIKQAVLWILLILLLGLTGGLTGCGEKNPNANQAVCIYDGSAVWAEASNKSKWLSSLAVGETAIFEGKPVIDEADEKKREYIKIKLSDGTKGWISTWSVVLGAYVGVIQESTKIYKRPDLLSESGKNFDTMNIVAVEEENGDWVRVTGEGRVKSGWLQKSIIRKNKEDVITAVLLKKAINKKKGEMTQEEMETTVATLPYPNSYFAMKMLEKYTPVTVDEGTDFTEEATADDGPMDPTDPTPDSNIDEVDEVD